jgi:hypothetical protein
MDVGDPEREYVVEPIVDPVPRELPAPEHEPEPAAPQEPVPGAPS